MRGPLFAARGYARLLLEDGDVTVTQRKYLSSIAENMNRLSALVADLQEPPSDDALELGPVSVRDVLKSCVENFGDLTLQFDLHLPSDPLWTVADGAKLAGGVHKLLTWVVDFSRSDARIELRAALEDDELVVRCLARNDDANGTAGNGVTHDVEAAFRILRLHGGAASAGTAAPGIVHVTFTLPLIPPVR